MAPRSGELGGAAAAGASVQRPPALGQACCGVSLAACALCLSFPPAPPGVAAAPLGQRRTGTPLGVT